ncbi:MAG: preprotein translocase subunit SecE [Bryobacteraceae bacterium]
MATVANVQQSENKPVASGVTEWVTRARDYIQDLRGEMARVTWPSWSQVRSTTGVVLVAIFLFAAYFAVVDVVMSRFVQRIFATFV